MALYGVVGEWNDRARALNGHWNHVKHPPRHILFCWDSVIDKRVYETRYKLVLLREVRLQSGYEVSVVSLIDIVTMISRGRKIQEWVREGSSTFWDNLLRRKLVDSVLDFVRSLPANCK